MVTARNTREDVVAAAGRLFASRGYHGTSMRDLGKELGLHGSSLYSHISSKEDLLVEVVQRGAELFEASATDAARPAGTPSEQLERLISGHVDVLLDHAEEAKTYLDEASSLEDEHRDRIIAERDAYEGVFRDVISRGAADGTFSQDIDPKMAAIFTLSTLNALERWYNPTGPLDRSGLKAALVGHIGRSLGGRL